jgi:hypothetical protein
VSIDGATVKRVRASSAVSPKKKSWFVANRLDCRLLSSSITDDQSQ